MRRMVEENQGNVKREEEGNYLELVTRKRRKKWVDRNGDVGEGMDEGEGTDEDDVIKSGWRWMWNGEKTEEQATKKVG